MIFESDYVTNETEVNIFTDDVSHFEDENCML